MAKIVFHPSSEDHALLVPPPQPAQKYKCDWWDKTAAFYEGKDLYRSGGDALTIKHCIPFRDSLFSGYIQESWQDIRFDVNPETDKLSYSFPTMPPIIDHRQHASMPVGPELHSTELTVLVPWMPSTPPGWSVIITQPFNRPELPFYTPTGIVDTDHLNNTTGVGNFPVYLRKDAPNIIKSGTPLYQIIPFKREDWTSETALYDRDAHKKMFATLHKTFWGGYKKNFWQKKSYK